jgi:hypothetical protein
MELKLTPKQNDNYSAHIKDGGKTVMVTDEAFDE